MTVFVVTTGSYSDYRIRAICRSKDRAEQIKTHLNTESSYEEAEHEEWELDELTPDDNHGLMPYNVTVRTCDHKHFPAATVSASMLEDAVSFPMTRNRYDASPYWPNMDFGQWSVTVMARDKDHAIKIAGDKRTELLHWWHVLGGKES